LIGVGLLSVVCGRLGADAHASPGRLWIGSSASGVWESSAAGIPSEVLVALAEGGFGVSVAYEMTTGNGRGSEHVRRLPVAQLESFFSHNQPTGVLVASYQDDFSGTRVASHQEESSGTVVYVPERDVWDELSTSEAVERLSLVLAAASVLLAGADLPEVEGLAPFAPAADSGDHLEVFFLADGEPNGDSGAWSTFTLEVTSTAPEVFLQGWSPVGVGGDGYDLLDARDFIESPYISSTPFFGVRTPDRVFDLWVHPAVTGAELSATRDVLLDAVELWDTEPMLPTEQFSLNY
jgi:hypothetical protein